MVILKRAEMGGGRRGVKPCDPSKVRVERGGSGYVKPETVLKGAGIVGKSVSVKGAEKPKGGVGEVMNRMMAFIGTAAKGEVEVPHYNPPRGGECKRGFGDELLEPIGGIVIEEERGVFVEPTENDIPAKESVGGEVCMPELPLEAKEREWTEEEYRARDERLAAADAAGVAFPSVEPQTVNEFGGRRKRRRRKHRHG